MYRTFFPDEENIFMNFLQFLFPSIMRWPKLTTKHVYMRHFDKKYLENLRFFLNDSEIVRNSFGIPQVYQINGIVEKYLTQIKQNPDKTLGIFSQYGGAFIGVAHITCLNWIKKEYKFGIMIGDKNYQNKGIGKDCVSAVLKCLFGQKNARAVMLETADFNVRAQKCFENCGFRQIEMYNQVDEFTSLYLNKILYRITKEEYQKKAIER